MIDKCNFVIGIDFISSLGIRITNISYCEYLPEGFRSVAEIRFENKDIDRTAFASKFTSEERMEIIDRAFELLECSIPVEFK